MSVTHQLSDDIFMSANSILDERVAWNSIVRSLRAQRLMGVIRSLHYEAVLSLQSLATTSLQSNRRHFKQIGTYVDYTTAAQDRSRRLISQSRKTFSPVQFQQENQSKLVYLLRS